MSESNPIPKYHISIVPRYSGCFLSWFEQVLIALGLPANPDSPLMMKGVPECFPDRCDKCPMQIDYYSLDTKVKNL